MQGGAFTEPRQTSFTEKEHNLQRFFPFTHESARCTRIFGTHCSNVFHRLSHLSLEGSAAWRVFARLQAAFRFARYWSLLSTFLASLVLPPYTRGSEAIRCPPLCCGLRLGKGDLVLGLRRGRGERWRFLFSGHSGVTGACPSRFCGAEVASTGTHPP